MPSRTAIRKYDAPAYYHVYNRGAAGQRIFRDAQDKRKFITLLERYLSSDPSYAGYPTYNIQLQAYCVMGNHFHLLLYQEDEPYEISGFMRSVLTAYSMYYNLRYKGSGHVFQGVFKASLISDEAYLAHISRYIHLNPETYKTYKWSSLQYYLGEPAPTWLHVSLPLEMTSLQYNDFLEDYIDRRRLLKEIKEQLAL